MQQLLMTGSVEKREATPLSCMCLCRGGGRAAIMGIGRAIPVHHFPQSTFPDYYFEVTKSDHMVDLKARFARICANTAIEKRHLYMSQDSLRSSPSMTAYKSPSLTMRQELVDVGIPELGMEAALNAIRDWGKHASDITHLVVVTSSSGCLPGPDFKLSKLLGLPPSTRRFMVYQTGCHGGGMALRLSKDIAENNPGARVLVICSEVCSLIFRGPSESHIGNLVGQAIFADAAGAVVVGSSPSADERPIFEIVSASQDTIPGSEEAVTSTLREEGIMFNLSRDVALHISNCIERLVRRALSGQEGTAAADVNDEVFWMVHAGGREILDRVESSVGLRKEKLRASREVMRQYGNTRSSCVLLVMEEMRRESQERGLRTAGEGLEWGLLVGFGPGLTVETILLRALHLANGSRSSTT